MRHVFSLLIFIFMFTSGCLEFFDSCPATCDDANACTKDYCDSTTDYTCAHVSWEDCKGNIELNCYATDTLIPIAVQLESRLNTTFLSCYVINRESIAHTVILSAEIPAWSDRYTETFLLPPDGFIQKNISLSYKDKFFTNNELTDASIVFDLNSEGKLLASDSKKIQLAPKEDIAWAWVSENGEEIDLSYTIAAWVTPHDQCINSLLGIAKELTSSRSLQGYVGYETLTDDEKRQKTREQAHAIYDAIKGQKISYVSTPVSFTAGTQRVKLPAASLSEKSGNCIDGTVLFASAFEALGMDTLLVFTPGHAHIGVETIPNSKEYLFIETTLVGTADFDEAVTSGDETFKKYKGTPDLTTIKLTDYRNTIKPFPSLASCTLATICDDGTKSGQCAKEKPKLCIGSQLVDRASKCGCPGGYSAYGDSCTTSKVKDTTFIINAGYFQSYSSGSSPEGYTLLRYIIDSDRSVNIYAVPSQADYQALYQGGEYLHYSECYGSNTLHYNQTCSITNGGLFVIENPGSSDVTVRLQIFSED